MAAVEDDIIAFGFLLLELICGQRRRGIREVSGPKPGRPQPYARLFTYSQEMVPCDRMECAITWHDPKS